MTGLMIALIPALLWGTLPLVSTKMGGTPNQQAFGMTIGAIFFSIVVSFIVPPIFNWTVVMISFISGLFWAVGQLYQFAAMKTIGISKTMPVSTGMQLAGAALCGVLIFGEWNTAFRLSVGLTALVLIVAGVLCTSHEPGKNGHTESISMIKGILLLLLSTSGYVSYIVILRLFDINGWSAILPQSAGMITGALLLSGRQASHLITRETAGNMISGLMWGGGNIALLMATKLEGVATSFSLSQVGTVLSTLGGIFLLGEKKSKTQMIFVMAGCFLIVTGGVLLGMTKQ
ncbi:GRP family sugar transporter [Sporolactobacillus sp. Y61]|uniref:GRP family sugar transporter n=1 Tax=Sporolactobacillus sp. Y61 TaxID=3160863 RepID=A0AAU8IDX4_9BACL|nr:GRP family sugar transporter [Sporolactobacillus sp. THM19-2]RYL87859.1 glucose transporter GlcU [Sporolactobacillus sp. THM19-2]